MTDDLLRALERSNAHPDMQRYVELAREYGGTPVLSSLRLFNRESDIEAMGRVGSSVERTLFKHGAKRTLSKHGNVDQTNTEILNRIIQENGS